jgi:hypothetical protein
MMLWKPAGRNVDITGNLAEGSERRGELPESFHCLRGYVDDHIQNFGRKPTNNSHSETVVSYSLLQNGRYLTQLYLCFTV